jgi:hypothetical protein
LSEHWTTIRFGKDDYSVDAVHISAFEIAQPLSLPGLTRQSSFLIGNTRLLDSRVKPGYDKMGRFLPHVNCFGLQP